MTPILAASEIELVIGIIVFVIWVLGALASKLKGGPQQQQQPGQPSPLERMQQEIAEHIRIAHGHSAPPPPLPQQPMPREASRQWPVQQPTQQQQHQQRQAKQRQQKKPKPPRPVFADVPPPPLPKSSPIVAVPLPPKPAIAAPQIRRWLTPATLRQQFILTELFQPPMSMREDR
jgi:hypothetical protein